MLSDLAHFLVTIFTDFLRADKIARGWLHPSDKRTYKPRKSKLEQMIEERDPD